MGADMFAWVVSRLNRAIAMAQVQVIKHRVASLTASRIMQERELLQTVRDYVRGWADSGDVIEHDGALEQAQKNEQAAMMELQEAIDRARL